MPRPQKYDKSVRDGLISDAAAIIADGGTNALSLRALAKGRDLSTTAIYTLFGSKDDLITETAAAAIDSFAKSQEAIPRGEDPIAHLYALGRAYREWALEYKALYRLVFGGRLYDPAAPRQIDTLRAMKPLQAVVQRLLDDGVFGGEPLAVSATLWSSVHGFVTLEMGPLQAVPRPGRDAMFETLLGITANGCRRTDPGNSGNSGNPGNSDNPDDSDNSG